MDYTEVEPLLSSAIATGAATAHRSPNRTKTYQASGTTSAGAGASTIVIQGSNNNSTWVTIGTITLTLSTTASSDAFTSDDRFTYVRANVTAISGTDATVSAYMSA